MDEDAYRETYWQLNENQCQFEKTILTNQCRCSLVKRLYLAEREAAQCTQEASRQLCRKFLRTLGEQAQFTLKSRKEGRVLPHAKAVKLQMGGLRGLHQLLHPDTPIPEPITDVHALLRQAKDEFGELSTWPMPRLLPHIASFKIKKRRGRRKPKD